jgi:hypothetical protein
MLDWERFMLEHTELDVLIVNYEDLSKVWLSTTFKRLIRISVHGHCAIPTIIVRFIDIGGIVDYHCAKFIFIIGLKCFFFVVGKKLQVQVKRNNRVNLFKN